ncbi:MAG: TIGR03936 family radical SAM-associated protein [Anaerolineales bacterium]
MRLHITFSKTEIMRYTGHLDVHRTLYRTLIRARLPVSHSQGYARRPRLNLAVATPLGFTSDCEIADLWLDEQRPLDEIKSAIQSVSPPGLRLRTLKEVASNSPKMQKTVVSAEFVATFLDPVPDLDTRVADLLLASTLPRERRGKTYDLRPLVLDLRGMKTDEQQCIQMTLMAQEGATGRADEVVSAMGIDPVDVRFHRTQLNFQDR